MFHSKSFRVRFFYILAMFSIPNLFYSGGAEAKLSFDDEVGYLINAFYDAGIDLDTFEQMRSPYRGKRSYRLAPKDAPWGSYYFPYVDGGIANRWQTNEGGSYRTLNRNVSGRSLPPEKVLLKIKALSQSEINSLSAAEKFDIYMGYYDFRTTEIELKQRGPQGRIEHEGWEGFCNGRNAASVGVPEPQQAIDVVNDDGIEVRFEIIDLKALASASFFYVELYAQIGNPTRDRAAQLDNPPDAGLFDIALRSYLAVGHRPFMFDIHEGHEIWNSTIIGYKRKTSRKLPLEETDWDNIENPEIAYKIKVDLELYYHEEISLEDANTVTRDRIANGWMNLKKNYSYYLYIDEFKKIRGGQFIGNQGPDFLWFPNGIGADDTLGVNSNLDFESIRSLIESAE